MNRYLYKLIFSLFFLFFIQGSYGQVYKPGVEVGRPLPEFVFSSDDHRSDKLISNKDLNGKPTILYYWNTKCTACIIHFKHASELQKQFKNQLNIIVVGLNFQKTESHIKKVYSTFEKRWDLSFISVYDTTFAIKNNIEDFPTIWIDDKGIVKAYGSSISITEDNIKSFLNGKLNLKDIRIPEVILFDKTKPLAVGENGVSNAESFRFRSILGIWKREMPIVTSSKIVNLDKKNPEKNSRYRFELSGVDMETLYTFALTMKSGVSFDRVGNYRAPLFETGSSFRVRDRTRYFYSIIIPDSASSDELVSKYMLQDLQRYFGYTGLIENRLLPCWILKADKNAMTKLKSKGGQWEEKITHISFKITNRSFDRLVYYLNRRAFGPDMREEQGVESNFLWVLNESGIPNDFLTDLDLKTLYLDTPDHVNAELKKYGLYLVKENRYQNVIVLKDAK